MCVCIEDVVAVLRELRKLQEINFSMAMFHDAISEVKKNFDALGRDEWRVQVQPVLADVVRAFCVLFCFCFHCCVFVVFSPFVSCAFSSGLYFVFVLGLR